MNRLMHMIRWEFMLQFRYNIYYAVAFATVIDIVLVTLVFPNDVTRIQGTPAMLMLSLVITAFYFVIALMLFEKDENVLEGLVVTPMRYIDYLISKSVTLTLATLASALLVALAAFLVLLDAPGFFLNWFYLALGGLLLGGIGVFVGVWFGARFDGFNEALLPASLFLVVLEIPLFHYFNIFRSPLFYLLPTQGPMTLFGAAFGVYNAPLWEIGLALLSSILWVGFSYWLAQRAFERFVVRTKGERT